MSVLFQLISDAIRYGDCHRQTMEVANFYLLEKQLVHKLFKVLVPRFENYQVSYTRMFKAPREYPGHYRQRSVLELRGNPYPSLVPDFNMNRNLLHNVLLDEARKAHQKVSDENNQTIVNDNTEKNEKSSVLKEEVKVEEKHN